MEKNKEQEKRLDYLLKEFKADSVEYKDIEIPEDINGKRCILRSLMNVRMPKKMSDSVLKVQDEYLSVCAEEKGIVQISDIPVIKGNVSIWQGDITRLEVDAIVNAANSQMLGCFIPMHMCIDNQIHTYAGIQLREECSHKMKKLRKKYGNYYEQPTAIPMITNAYNLPARNVIHIVGPIVRGRLTPELEQKLVDCYKKVFFYTQGDYGLFQSVNPQIRKTYDNEKWVMKAMETQGFVKDENGVFSIPESREILMRIPTELIPKCSDDGSDMTTNLRADSSFVEDEGWHTAAEKYSEFLENHKNVHVLFLELGVGANTPVIVKYPFWYMVMENKKAVYACVNYQEAFCPNELEERSICIE